MEKTAKIALLYPAQLSDRTLSSITMRRPTVGDMLDYPIKNGGTRRPRSSPPSPGCAPKTCANWTWRIMSGCRTSSSRFGARKDPDGILEKGLRMLVVSLSRLTRWPLRDVLALTPDEAEAWLDTACELEKRLSA